MAADYDTPRTSDDEIVADSLEALKASSAASAKVQTAVDLDETDLAESLELPGADLSGETLVITVVPQQDDEFMCRSCFLIQHRDLRASGTDPALCIDCAA